MRLRLYDSADSGNAYKVRLALAHLGLACERVEMDTDRGDTRTPEFLAINANGRIPVLEVDGRRRLAESNAILYYLGRGTGLFPDEPWAQAKALEWMFFEQYSHEPYVAVSRYIRRHLPAGHPRYEELPALRVKGEAAFAVMETHLDVNGYFSGSAFGIADIALYAYSHVAEQGGFDLAPWPAVRAWLDRVAAEPDHVPIDA